MYCVCGTLYEARDEREQQRRGHPFFSYSRLFERKKLQPRISKRRVWRARGRRANLRMMPSNHMVDDARIPHRLHQAPQA